MDLGTRTLASAWRYQNIIFHIVAETKFASSFALCQLFSTISNNTFFFGFFETFAVVNALNKKFYPSNFDGGIKMQFLRYTIRNKFIIFNHAACSVEDRLALSLNPAAKDVGVESALSGDKNFVFVITRDKDIVSFMIDFVISHSNRFPVVVVKQVLIVACFQPQYGEKDVGFPVPLGPMILKIVTWKDWAVQDPLLFSWSLGLSYPLSSWRCC